MTAWRVVLAAGLHVGACFALFYSGMRFMEYPLVQVLVFLGAIAAGLGALCLAQDDGRVRGGK